MIDFQDALPALDGQIVSGYVSRHWDRPREPALIERFPSGVQRVRMNPRKVEYCEANYGLGYKDRGGWMGVVYRNSLCHTAVQFGYEAAVWERGRARLLLGAGVVTGYDNGLDVYAYPALAMRFGRAEIVAGAIPPISGSPGAAWVQFRYSLAD